MLSLFSFRGKMTRLPYAVLSLGIFFAQYLLVAAVFWSRHQPLDRDWRFLATPLRSLVELNGLPIAALPLAVGISLLVAWALAASAFRRANDASVNGWVAAFAVAPVFQVALIFALSFIPSRDEPSSESVECTVTLNWRAATEGMLAGAAITLLAVVVGALLFGTYGFGMFVVAPFVIGAITAFLANRQDDIGFAKTAQVITASLVLGGAALVVAALEGIVCILLASPLALGAALIGGALGRSVALSRAKSVANSSLSIALIPLVFGAEHVLPPSEKFVTSETILVSARPHDVWLAIVHMDTIESAPALPFRLGVAYPVRGRIVGSGVGAVRIGTFSTGDALERVTEWQDDRKLAFVVTSDPPAMRELSPYPHVNAPHVRGYFRTTFTSFEILPIDSNRCRIVEETRHELRLDPVLYWMPFARWMIHENNMRVLTHIREQAERSANELRI